MESKVRTGQIIDQNPERRKVVIEKMNAFLEDKISLAEFRGVSKTQMQLLTETGHVKLRHGRLDEAEQIFRGLLLLDHRNSYFHSAMGAIHQKKNKPVEAIFEYSTALSIFQGDIASLINRGEVYLRHKNYKKAAQDFKTAILLDPSGRNLWANRARSLVIAIKRSMESEFSITRKQ